MAELKTLSAIRRKVTAQYLKLPLTLGKQAKRHMIAYEQGCASHIIESHRNRKPNHLTVADGYMTFKASITWSI